MSVTSTQEGFALTGETEKGRDREGERKEGRDERKHQRTVTFR